MSDLTTPFSATTRTDIANQLDVAIRPFQSPSRRTSLAQLVTSFGGFIASSAAIYTLVVLVSPFWILLAPVASGFLVRVFIIQHDCGHGASIARSGPTTSSATPAVCSPWRPMPPGGANMPDIMGCGTISISATGASISIPPV